jgi:hypothetical protein
VVARFIRAANTPFKPALNDIRECAIMETDTMPAARYFSTAARIPGAIKEMDSIIL